jgi:CHAT domain
MPHLGSRPRTRFRRTGDASDLQAAIEADQAAVDATATDHPSGASMLFNLGSALQTRYTRTGAQADRAAALAVFTQAAQISTAGPSVTISAAREATALLAPADPDHAAALLEKAVQMLPEITPRRLGRNDQQHTISAVRLADEAIHLTSAFQLAGFPHVIGTLWPIADRIAVAVASDFYDNLRIGGTLDAGRAAHALHRSVRAVRDTIPATPSLWAAYLHAGA